MNATTVDYGKLYNYLRLHFNMYEPIDSKRDIYDCDVVFMIGVFMGHVNSLDNVTHYIIDCSSDEAWDALIIMENLGMLERVYFKKCTMVRGL